MEGSDVLTYYLDLLVERDGVVAAHADEAQGSEMVETTLREFGRIDVLVDTVGGKPVGPAVFLSSDASAWITGAVIPVAGGV